MDHNEVTALLSHIAKNLQVLFYPLMVKNQFQSGILELPMFSFPFEMRMIGASLLTPRNNDILWGLKRKDKLK